MRKRLATRLLTTSVLIGVLKGKGMLFNRRRRSYSGFLQQLLLSRGYSGNRSRQNGNGGEFRHKFRKSIDRRGR